MARSGEATRERLLDAAEQLFAERGIDAVALAEVNVAAGQRNNSAAHYHFGDKAGLVDAVLERRQPEIDARRAAALDALATRGRARLAEIVDALVRPVADQLDDPSGVAWLQVQAQLLSDPQRSPLARRPWQRALDQIALLVEGSPDAETAHWSPLRNALVNTLVFHGLADYARGAGGGGSEPEAEIDRASFVDTLVAAVTAIVTAPEPAGV